MPGRHSSGVSASTGRRIAVGVTVLALLGGGAYAGSRMIDEGELCGQTAELSVAAAVEISPVIQDAAQRATRSNPCYLYTVTATDPSTAAKRISGGRPIDAWVPDSSTWTDTLTGEATGMWNDRGSLASSPITLAGPADLAGEKDPTSWFDVVDGRLGSKLTLALANPYGDAPSRLAYLASRQGAPEKLSLTTGAKLIGLSRSSVPTTGTFLTTARSDPSEPTAFPASEQQVVDFNTDATDSFLTARIPTQGTMVLDYPWLSSPRLSAVQEKAQQALLAAMADPTSQADLKALGFRTPSGGVPEIPSGEGATPGPAFKTLSLPDDGARTDSMQQWNVLRLDIRMLAVLDVSGSMKYGSSTAGLTRWQVLKGACVTALQIMPGGSEVGGWVFSTNLNGKGRDYRQLGPIQRLDKVSGAGTHRDDLIKVVQRADRYLGGDTGLYDTTLAAFNQIQRTWERGHVNSVVVMTDGKNDDPGGGISLKTLLDRLKKANDPDKPVRIITIGMGEADPSALRQISAATGGTSYIANTPSDIQRVFVEALLARPLEVK